MKGFIEVTVHSTKMPMLIAVSSIVSIEALEYPVLLIIMNKLMLPDNTNPNVYIIGTLKGIKDAILEADQQ